MMNLWFNITSPNTTTKSENTISKIQALSVPKFNITSPNTTKSENKISKIQALSVPKFNDEAENITYIAYQWQPLP